MKRDIHSIDRDEQGNLATPGQSNELDFSACPDSPDPGSFTVDMKPLQDMSPEELQRLMRTIGGAIDSMLPPLTNFIVLVGDYYVSNISRDNAVEQMRLTADRLEKSHG
jgi:hypothetical protein